VKIPTGEHCNHRMISVLSFMCVCVFVIVCVLGFVLACTAQNTLLLYTTISTFQLIPHKLKKLSIISLYLKKRQLLQAMKQLPIYSQNAEYTKLEA